MQPCNALMVPHGAPFVPLSFWVRAMGRRIESQFRRDWMLCFTMWNYIFRQAVNLSKTVISYATPKASGLPDWTGQDIERGAIAICKALHGKYETPSGQMKNVGGDLSKVRYVPDLPPAAHRLLTHISHVSRSIPGTQEVRRTMRHETHAYRCVYGEPIFVTFSPNEKESTLMIRLSRARASDPVHIADSTSAKWCHMHTPSLDEDFMKFSVEEL